MKTLLRFKVKVFYSLIIFLALLKVIAFTVAVYAEHNKDHIEQLASAFIGTPIHIEHIKTSWSGFTPKLWLKNLAAGTNRELHLGDALVSVALLELPHWQQNLPLKIKLQGTKIHALRDAQGKTRVKGLSTTHNEIALPARIRIEDATLLWEDHKHGDVQLQLDQVDIHLLSQGPQARLSIRTADRRLQARADIAGSVAGSDWSATTYIETHGLDAAPLLAPYLSQPYSAEQLRLNLRAWSTWSHGVHMGTRANLDIDKLRFTLEHGTRFELDHLKTDLLYQHIDKGWRLQLSGFGFHGRHHYLESTDMVLDVKPVTNESTAIYLAAGKVQLQPMIKLLRIRPLDDNLLGMLDQLAPLGELHNPKIQMTTGEAADWKLETGLENLYTSAWNKLPELNNLSAQISAVPGRIIVDLNSQDAEVFPKTLFRTPIAIQKLHGRMVLEFEAKDRWSLNSDALVAENQDLKTRSRLRIEARPDQPLFLDLQSDFRDGHGQAAGGYYPAGIMNPKLVEWLDRAIVDGHVTRGSFLLHGPARGFPYHETHDGHFEVLFDVENAELDYREAWPPLRQVDARVRFHNNSLEISSNRGAIYATSVLEAKARIERLKPISEIRISGRTKGPLADHFLLLRETPLKDKLAEKIHGMEASGEAILKTEFSIPLNSNRQYQFSGELLFVDSGLRLTDHDLELSRINGQLAIDLEGISGSGITAETMGGKTMLDIQQTAADTTVIKADTGVSMAGLYRQFPFLTAIPAEGTVEAQVTVEIPNDALNTQAVASLQIQSDLQGVQIDLPEPVRKQVANTTPLRLDMPLTVDQTDISIQYGSSLDLKINIDPSENIRISGRLPEIKPGDWQSYFDSRTEAEEGPAWHSMDVTFDALDIGLSRFEDLRLKAKRTALGWEGSLDSDSLNGSFRIPEDLENEPITIALDQLHLTYDPNDKTSYTADDDMDSISPADFPALDFSCWRLKLNQADLGQFHLRLNKSDYGLELSELNLRGGIATLSVNGSWEQYPATQLSELSGFFNSQHMDQLLDVFLEEPFIADGDTEIAFDLSWRGALHEFALEKLEGNLELDTGQGRFLQIKPGAARVLGLINVRSLDRRLKLDFSDVTKKGYAFDSIAGSFNLDKGLMFTNDLHVKAPSSQIRIAGMADLSLETLDLLITVSPRLDATLPVAGAVVGGPVTGLAMLVAQQAFSSKLEKIQRMRYSVQGSWDDPEIEPVRNDTPEEDDADLLEQ